MTLVWSQLSTNPVRESPWEAVTWPNPQRSNQVQPWHYPTNSCMHAHGWECLWFKVPNMAIWPYLVNDIGYWSLTLVNNFTNYPACWVKECPGHSWLGCWGCDYWQLSLGPHWLRTKFEPNPASSCELQWPSREQLCTKIKIWTNYVFFQGDYSYMLF